MGEGCKGVRDYEIVIELLRENLVEPVTPAPTSCESSGCTSSTVIHTAVQLYCTILYCAVLKNLQLSEEMREPSRRWWRDRDL